MSQVNPLHYNGGAVFAATGNQCVAIAADRRFGQAQLTLACDANRLFRVHDRLVLGLTGLATDCLTLAERVRMRTNLYRLGEKREPKPATISALVSALLYERRFAPYFVEPVIVGLSGDNKPYCCSMDLLGTPMETDEFVAAGTCAESLYGTGETFWRPGLDPEDLFEVTAQCMLAALDRDCLSGWGAVVYVLHSEGVTVRELKARMD
ncbi:20S core proteasome subunit beta 3 [Cyanidioschyzon merolae strain 10D]|jgi:20S proteasome subunit beta 3|uniref:20S core proteasome subunit beta 3 n=1 Tax=Cyanidioschyzon merolae (strain NIES-3377 / 10D) TaxID=280699 RepID=M1V7D3_CYAM1|nr:20S core proteasome subunit beta 3 [Cyanidioschyzon merolae strain 10D]BAM79684.1 20S core proteasome subunit beta 3 [Cyanidioschyzon merolae strain 10D]|eukprot:XP_005535970.1 20S core proteasome subunit beta 3 [Cyanidioschyzon merolae strain 10D]